MKTAEKASFFYLVNGAVTFKKMIDEVFKTELAEKAKVKTNGMETIIDFGRPVVFNSFVAEEDIRYGQRVKRGSTTYS